MKKILFSAAMVAAVLSSCSNNEMVENLPQTENPNAIGLSTGIFVTKSAETTTANLNQDGNRLTLYSTDANFGTSGALEFTRTSGNWIAAGNETWADVAFPVNIFSMYDGANVVVTPGTGAAAAYTIQTNVADQKDLIYFGQTLEAIPSGGTIAATYKHALSRVKMENRTAAGMNVDYKLVKLKGFDGTAVPTIDTDNTVAWTGNDDAIDAAYAYDLVNAATQTNDMYIIPQTTATHAGSGNAVIEGVEALCVTYVGATRIAGWESVADFKTANPRVTSVKYTRADGEADYTSGKMYVKVVFPISNQTFTNGIYYNLQLNFAGATLQYVDSKYYDVNGKELVVSGTTITPDPDTHEPVNPNSSDKIGLTVQVNPWPTGVNVP